MTGPTLKIHPLAAALPAMLRDEYVELVADIKANGLREPLMLFEDQVLDGRHRCRACVDLGIALNTRTFTGTTADAKAYVVSLNVHRRHLTFEQKQEVIDAELKRDPKQSDRSIAKKAKVDHKTVAKARARAVDGGEIPHQPERVGVDGVKQLVAKPTTAAATTASPPRPKVPVAMHGVVPSAKPCIGMQYARMAIERLEEIPHDDIERTQALVAVQEWIGRNTVSGEVA